MTRHLMRLIWNRKRHNLLLIAEIFFSFLALFAVVGASVTFANNWRKPLGFSIERVWHVGVDVKETGTGPEAAAKVMPSFERVFAALADLPNVEIASAATTSPYSNSRWGSRVNLEDGRSVRYSLNYVTDALRDVLHVKLVAGRWFSREDDGAIDVPVVINQRMAIEIFGDRSPLGRRIPAKQERSSTGNLPDSLRVVGVIEDFRHAGELSRLENFLFRRMQMVAKPGGGVRPSLLLIRVTPGTTAAFEELLVGRLQAAARDWSFDVRRLEDMRQDILRLFLTPLIGFGTVALFLLLMVALGLTGVLWQSVTERIREFGLRRAKGATIPNVQHQVLAELTIMTSIALLLGVVLVGQLPFVIPDQDLQALVNPGVFATSIALSVAGIYLLTLVCGWYPSRLATKIAPAEALHYE